MDDLSTKKGIKDRDRRPWQTPEMVAVGTINQVLQGGMGKLSITGGDPGESRKQVGPPA
jgi:hypothetical protein